MTYCVTDQASLQPGVLSCKPETAPLPLLEVLTGFRSVTPADDGALAYMASVLAHMGFEVISLEFGPEEAPTPNLYARLGQGDGPFLCFAGHTDVVPAGENWASDPFRAIIKDGNIYGRGVADMKGGIACALAAMARLLEEKRELKGRIAFLITGDEEGPARFGTCKVLEWMEEHGERPDFCLLGEPTNPSVMGEMVKIGRRGSLNAVITVEGEQGHVAYPHLAENPLPSLIALLNALTLHCLDRGSAWFTPSSLQITSIDVGNEASNVIPARAVARLNIRFNDCHTGESLSLWLRAMLAEYAPEAQLEISVSGESFLTEPGASVQMLVQSIEEISGRTPKLDTAGGTSDARFITHLCPVAEFGLVNETIHKCNEHVSLASLEELTRIYHRFMQNFGL